MSSLTAKESPQEVTEDLDKPEQAESVGAVPFSEHKGHPQIPDTTTENDSEEKLKDIKQPPEWL